MKRVLLLICMIFTSNLYSQSFSHKYTYDIYLKDLETKKSVYELIKKQDYEEALNKCNEMRCRGLLCREKYYLKALCFYGLNKPNKSKEFIRKAIENGYSPFFMEHNFMSKDLMSEDEINEAYRKYLTKIDTTKRKNFGYSLSFEYMNDYLLKNKWPGVNQIGHQSTCTNVLLKQKMIFTRIYEQNDSILIKCYDIIREECEKMNESWEKLENLVYSNIQKNVSRDVNIPLYFIFSDDNLTISEKSFLSIVVLSKFIKKKEIAIELKINCDLQDEQKLKLLDNLKAQLIEQGVAEIDIKTSLAKVEGESMFYFSICY